MPRQRHGLRSAWRRQRRPKAAGLKGTALLWEREPIGLGWLARGGGQPDMRGAAGLDGPVALVYYYSSTVWRAR